MSSVTPASYVDDGVSFTKRTPHGLQPAHIANWISSPGSETTSVYTGSYIDDGADMLDPNGHAPGFGQIDPRFYQQRKRNENEKAGLWNEVIQKAVSGDIQRNLEKIRGTGRLQVKRAERHEGNEKRDKHERRRETVTVALPPKWGTFVIKGDDGRVYLIDEDGTEFDSGPPQAPVREQPAKWVKAPTTITVPSLPSPSNTNERRHSRDKDDRRHSRKDRKSKHSLAPVKTLVPIPESEYEYGHLPSSGEDLMSPTGFFMTGGKNGWPSRSVTSVASPMLPTRSSRRSSPLKPSSPVRSPPDSWPSPPFSATKTSSESENTRTSVGWREKKSHRSGSSKKWQSHGSSRRDADNVSTKSYSTYKPATVEGVPDTSSGNSSGLKDAAWGGSTGAGGWKGSKAESGNSWTSGKKGIRKSLRHSTKFADNNAWTAIQPADDFHQPAASQHAPSPSVQNWVGDKVKTISTTSTSTSSYKSRHGSHSRSHRSQSRSHAPRDKTGEALWDGYEIPKTLSEVSVAGSNDSRNSLDSRTNSQASSWRPFVPSDYNYRSSKYESQSGLGGESEQWGGSQKATVHGWSGDGAASENGTGSGGFGNGYHEDNETYLNENWGGMPVRVRRRRESVSSAR